MSTIKLTRRHNPEIIFELPKTCDYWQDPSVVRFVEHHGLISHECDGCMVGIVDMNNLPLKKTWLFKSTFVLQRIVAFRCTHAQHGESRGKALKLAESYTHVLTEALHMDFHDHVKACKKSTQYKVPPNSPAKSYGVVASIGGEPCNCGMADAKVLPRGETQH